MLEFLKNLDKDLFLLINGWHNQAVDSAMFYITDTEFWFPFYGALVLFLLWKIKWKAIPFILLAVAAIGISDAITSQFMKPFFERLRPCHEPGIMETVHLVDGCGKLYGFASGHASNSFAMATALWLCLRETFRPFVWIFAWCALVSYSRIYVGEHYPGDVLVGALIGTVVSILLYLIFKRYYELLPDKLRIFSLP